REQRHGGTIFLMNAPPNTLDNAMEYPVRIKVEPDRGRLAGLDTGQMGLAIYGAEPEGVTVDQRKELLTGAYVIAGGQIEVGDEPVGRRNDARVRQVQVRGPQPGLRGARRGTGRHLEILRGFQVVPCLAEQRFSAVQLLDGRVEFVGRDVLVLDEGSDAVEVLLCVEADGFAVGDLRLRRLHGGLVGL